jgi:hypothetical protein
MLTNDQIDQLFTFCEKHFVHHYDVQAELVDHLANAIEERMASDEKISFESALASVHAGFGVLGFAGVVNSRSSSLSIQYRKLKKQLFFSYFTWPKAAMTACLFLLLMLPLKFLVPSQLSVFMLVPIYFLVGFEIFIGTKYVLRIKKQNRKLLFTETAYYESWITFFIITLFVGNDHVDFVNNKSHTAIVITYGVNMFIYLLLFLSMLAWREMNQQVYLTAKKQYPEAFAVVK